MGNGAIILKGINSFIIKTISPEKNLEKVMTFQIS